MCEDDLAVEIRGILEDDQSSDIVFNCDSLPTENAAFAIDLDSGERYVVTVTQVSE